MAPAPWSVTEAEGGTGAAAMLGAADASPVEGAALVAVVGAATDAAGDVEAPLLEQALRPMAAIRASAPRRLGVVITR